MALETAAEVLEQEAWRRAVTGTLKPVYQGGEQVGTVREYSNTLMIFLLKGANPEKYRERVQQQHSGEVTVRVAYVNDWRNRSSAGELADELMLADGENARERGSGADSSGG